MAPLDPAAVLESRRDPLATACLGRHGEPDLHRVWSALPPLVGPTFVGARDLLRKVLVGLDGTVTDIVTEPLVIEPGDAACYGDAVPAVLDLVGRNVAGLDTRRVLFARPLEGDVEVWWLEDAGGRRYYHHVHGRLAEASAERFEQALEGVIAQQAAELHEAATVQVPHLWRAGARLSLLRSLNSFCGRHPKYGWGGYEEPRHDTFPPTILALGHALIDYSLVSLAKELVGHWLTAFVKDDGALDYYGPSLSEAGQLLDLGVRLARAARDGAWCEAALAPLRRVADRLVALYRAQGGLLPGLPEADYHTDAAVGSRVYYSNNAWCVRGLLTLAHLLGEAGESYEACGQAWRDDVQVMLRADTIRLPDGQVYLPPVAGDHTPLDRLTADRDASYANYRFYPELLSSRLLTGEQATALFAWREQHGGELCGTTRFGDRLDDWPAMEVALAHLDHDRPLAAQRLLVGHLGLHHAWGHQTAYEQVGIVPQADGCRHPAAGHCVPTQLVVPRLLRNLLVHEAGDALWLNRGGLLSWLDEGCGVEEVTTRWGRVSFRLDPDGDAVRASVDATDLPAEVPVRVRLRRPDGQPVTRLEVDGQAVDVTSDTVVLPRRTGAVHLTAV